MRILEHQDYAVDTAFHGEKALGYLEAENYDVMLLDVRVPKINGIEVLKHHHS